MVTKTEGYINQSGLQFKVTWEEPEGHREKILNSILDDIGLSGESREATRKHLIAMIDSDPMMLDIGVDELSISASTYSEGFEDGMSQPKSSQQ
ncbi:MAG: hypothetical protein ABR958_05060 [Dehalococcoidales bacterium]